MPRLNQPFWRSKDGQIKFGARILSNVSAQFLQLEEFLSDDWSITIYIPQGHWCSGWILFQNFFQRSTQTPPDLDSTWSQISKANSLPSILALLHQTSLVAQPLTFRGTSSPETSSKPKPWAYVADSRNLFLNQLNQSGKQSDPT